MVNPSETQASESRIIGKLEGVAEGLQASLADLKAGQTAARTNSTRTLPRTGPIRNASPKAWGACVTAWCGLKWAPTRPRATDRQS